MSLRRTARWLSCGLALLATAPLAVHAQPDSPGEEAKNLEALRKRFREGMALESQGKWSEALVVFREVSLAKVTPHVLFHIALCEENLGKLKSAHDGYGAALELAEQDPESAKEVLDSAPKRKKDLEDKIPTLVLRVEDGGESELSIDGGPFEKVKGRRELRLDPGSHSVTVRTSEGDQPARDVTLAAGEKLEIDVPKSGAPAAGPKEQPAPEPKPTEPDVEPGTKIPFFVVGGVGVASLVVSGVMIGLRQATIAEVRDSCSGQDSGCDPALAEVAERGKAYEGAAWGLGFAGMACLGAATVLFFTVGQDTPKSQPKVSLQIAGTFASLRTSFD